MALTGWLLHAGSPALLVTSALLFLLIAWDVFGSGLDAPFKSFYVLPHYVDWPVHAWVKASPAHLLLCGDRHLPVRSVL